MKSMIKTKKALALSAAAVFVLGGAIAPSVLGVSAYTLDDVPTLEARTPDSLAAMTEQGFRAEGGMVNPNFEDGNAISRLEYGGPWAFAHIMDTVGWGKDDYTEDLARYSTYRVVEVNDAVNGMGKQAGKGDKITTAIEITINMNNQDTLADALTYSTLDDMMYGEVNQEAFYYTSWVKAEQDMWFDVGISFGAKADHAQVYWDLGRRFFVPAGQWTQIGVDTNGNYLPFRAKVTNDGFMRGTGADPTAANSNCTSAPDESKGDTKIGQYYRGGWGEVWACIRLYAYSGATYGTSGVGAPAANHGLSAGDKYLVTGANFWNQSAPAPVVKTYVGSVTLDKTTASVEEGKTLQLNATPAPENADDTTLYWYSSNETIATVDQTGKVTAIKEGTVEIVAEANDGAGAKATCNVTVTKKAAEPVEPVEPKEDGCCGSVIAYGGVGMLAAAALTLGAVLIVRKKN